ncbi:MAG: patatin-like phospholipase family protein [Caldilineaceae bacterium]|nr:patatin-like phospholipase family protein [Caldilineaceae bacterium]
MEQANRLPPETLSVGLALGGGGVRGLAIVGVLRVLEEAGIPIHSIAGTSIGGILGSLWAVGLRSAAIEAEVRRLTALSRMIRLVDWVPSLRGLMPGHKFYTYLDNLLGHHVHFEELKIPFAVVATDLNHWREATLTTGLVIDAVRASMSVPGVFAPVEIGDMRLVDGGFVNNVPVDVARGLGPDIVVAVDVDRQPTSADGGTPVLPIDSPLPNFTPLLVADLWLVTHIMADAVKQAKFQASPPDVRLIPAIPSNVGILSGLGHIDAIIASGAAAATAALPQLEALMAATPAELAAARHGGQQALSPVKIAPFMAQDDAHGTA